MLDNSKFNKTILKKQDTQTAKLNAFRQKFDEHYQSLNRILTSENALLILMVYAYLAYQYQPPVKLESDKSQQTEPKVGQARLTKTMATHEELVKISDIQVFSLNHSPSVFDNSSLLNLNQNIDQIVCLFSSRNDTNDTVKKLAELLDSINRGSIKTFFIRLRKTYTHKENYTQAILPIFSNYLASVSAKKQWGDTNTISALYQAIVGDISKLTLYDGASGLGNSGLLLSPAKFIMREKQCMPALLATLLCEMLGHDFEIQVLDSLTAKEISHQADIGICSPSYGVEVQPLWLIGANYLQFLDIVNPIPSSGSDSLWIQHCLYHLNCTGKAYLILPIGWLFKGGYDLAVREALIHRNLIESVTILPKLMRQHNQANLCLVILNKAKTTKNIWLINAENFRMNREYGGGVTEKSINELGKLIANPQENEFSVLATVTQIEENKYDLNPIRFLKSSIETAEIELSEQLKYLATYHQNYENSRLKLDELLDMIVSAKH